MKMIHEKWWYACLLFSPLALPAAQTNLSDLDFVVAPAFNNVQTFSFQLALPGPLGPGVVNNPELLTIATVPVPAAGWLLLTALGLGFGVSRKSG